MNVEVLKSVVTWITNRLDKLSKSVKTINLINVGIDDMKIVGIGLILMAAAILAVAYVDHEAIRNGHSIDRSINVEIHIHQEKEGSKK